jgi:aspartate/methionine/tyrosine aminotransferase
MGSLDFCFKLAEKAGVSFTPGIAFGPEGEGFVRIALVADEDRIREACRRVKTFLNKG